MNLETMLKELNLNNPYKAQYENYIGGKWTAPVDGQYFDNITPITGESFCKIPRSNNKDIDKALDAAHKASDKWGKYY